MPPAPVLAALLLAALLTALLAALLAGPPPPIPPLAPAPPLPVEAALDSALLGPGPGPELGPGPPAPFTQVPTANGGSTSHLPWLPQSLSWQQNFAQTEKVLQVSPAAQ
jgi:hypothetical protein